MQIQNQSAMAFYKSNVRSTPYFQLESIVILSEVEGTDSILQTKNLINS